MWEWHIVKYIHVFLNLSLHTSISDCVLCNTACFPVQILVMSYFKIVIKCLSTIVYLLSQDSESEEDILDEGDDDVEEEHDNELDVPVHPEPVVKKSPEVSVAPKEAERQLSKKERKKKELAELEALLADFGVAQKEGEGQDDSHGNCE